MGMSNREYAKHREVSEGAVRKAIRSGRILLEPDGTIDPDRADIDWEQNTNPAQQRNTSIPQGNALDDPATQQKSTSVPDYQTSRSIKAAYDARLAKLDFEVRSGKLVAFDDVQVEAFNLSRRVRDRLLNIPHRIAATCAAETDAMTIERTLIEELRSAMEELTE
ncbi:MAG: hypothetical protein HQL65_20445 [Magnetococcales bacterium]|nr:hypothetical protein [Magnetococcales bacterium]